MAAFSPAFVVLLSVCLAGMATFGLCLFAVRTSFGLDRVSERSNHSRPTPRMGGVMILIGSALGLVVIGLAGLISLPLAILLALSASAGVMGLADDFLELPPTMRLLVQIGLGAAAAFLLGPEQSFPVPLWGWITLPLPLALALTTFWIVGFMNVVNFMDGLNGLIGSVGLLLLALGASLLVEGSTAVMVIQAAVAGFLALNVFWGRIFLGDAGSLSLGFFLAGLALIDPQSEGVFWLMPLAATPLIADVAVTLVRRAWRRENLMEAHREHVYQRMRQAGWSHQACALTVLASVLVGLGLCTVLTAPTEHGAGVYWLSVVATIAFWGLASATMLAAKVESRVGLKRSLR